MKKLFVFLILPLALTACKDKADKNPITNVTQATKDRDLQGTWQSDCDLKPLSAVASGVITLFQASIKSGRIQYKFEGSNVNRVHLSYNSADCTGPETLVWNESGKFEIQENQKSNDGGRHMDMKFDKIFVTVKDANGVKVANEAKLCGFTDWSAGKERGVTGKSTDVNCYGAQVPRDSFNIYRIEKPAGNQPWVLTFGADPVKETAAANRPARLAADQRYLKK